MSTTSIVLFEDNDALRKSIGGMIALNSRYLLKDAFADAMRVAEEVKLSRPHVVLMDIEMPGRSGIEAVKIIRSFDSDLPILMLTVFDDSPHVLDAIRAGASGYLLKKDIPAKLFSAIEEVLSGGAPMSPSVARMVVACLQPNPQKDLYQLTSREKEILGLIATGNSYKMVAERSFISIETVRSHIKNIYQKLQVHSQAEAASKAVREGLV